MQHITEHALIEAYIVLLEHTLLTGNAVLLFHRENVRQVRDEPLGCHIHLRQRSAEFEILSEDKCLVVPDVLKHLLDGLHLVWTVRAHRNPKRHIILIGPEHSVIIEKRRHMADLVPHKGIVEFHIIIQNLRRAHILRILLCSRYRRMLQMM